VTAITPKYLVSQVIGDNKDKCAIRVARTSGEMSECSGGILATRTKKIARSQLNLDCK